MSKQAQIRSIFAKLWPLPLPLPVRLRMFGFYALLMCLLGLSTIFLVEKIRPHHLSSSAPASYWIGICLLGTLLSAVSVGIWARFLGATLENDFHLVLMQIERLSEKIKNRHAETTGKGPLTGSVVVLPQLAELSAFSAGLKILLTQATQLNVRHFVAIEKALDTGQLKMQFLANVSHDLRAPLNSILGFSELLENGMDGQLTEQQLIAVRHIHSEGQVLLRLINQVLDLAKHDAGRLALHREEVAMASLVNLALKDLQAHGIEKTVELETTLQPGIPVLLLDGQRLAEALTFLLHYAAEWLRRGRLTLQIKIVPATPLRLLKIEIEAQPPPDRGETKLPAEDLSRLFEGFHRRPQNQGLALGLPLAKLFVEMHEGSLIVEKTSAGGIKFCAQMEAREPEKMLLKKSSTKPPV